MLVDFQCTTFARLEKLTFLSKNFEVFRLNVEKRIRSLPEIEGLSKETVLNSWMAKYDAITKTEEETAKNR